MRFKATDEQVKQMAANAVNASKPMGMGHLHFEPSNKFQPDAFEISKDGLFLDYVGGRMVKLSLRKLSANLWETPSRPPTHDYQSWVGTYSGYAALVISAGGVAIE